MRLVICSVILSISLLWFVCPFLFIIYVIFLSEICRCLQVSNYVEAFMVWLIVSFVGFSCIFKWHILQYFLPPVCLKYLEVKKLLFWWGLLLFYNFFWICKFKFSWAQYDGYEKLIPVLGMYGGRLTFFGLLEINLLIIINLLFLSLVKTRHIVKINSFIH